MVVSGSTGSGKTVWTMRFLEHINKLVVSSEDKSPEVNSHYNSNNPVITSVLYCYGALNSLVLKLKRLEIPDSLDHSSSPPSTLRIKTHNGLPSEETIKCEAALSNRRLLLVLDDLMLATKGVFLDSLFTVGSHNWGVSVIMLTQHLFNKDLKIARSNAHYIVLLRNPAGALQVRNIASQLFPGQARYFMEAYEDATKERFTYILIDMHPNTADGHRLKTHIYPEEGYTIAYIPTTQKQ
jgi:hypothetical protein